MKTSFFKIDALLEPIGSGALILTPTQRLSSHIHLAYQAYQQQRGLTAWLTPQVYAFEIWLCNLWQEWVNQGNACQQLLSPAEERLLWEKIVADSGTVLLRPQQAAIQAQQSFQRLVLWNIAVEHPTLHEHPNSQDFASWAKTFVKLCQEKHLITLPETVPILQAALLEPGTVSQDKKLVSPMATRLVGFDDISPAYQQLLDVLPDVKRLDPSISCKRRARLTLADRAHELETAARWAKQTLRDEPHAHIGIIIPDLTARREEVDHVFSHIFSPTAQLHAQPTHTQHFNLSGGVPLAQTPIIHAAFLCLTFSGLPQRPLDVAELIQLVGSPFIGGWEAEFEARTRLVAALHDHQHSSITFKAFCKLCEKAGCFILSEILENFNNHLNNNKNFCINTLNKTLKVMNWPGERVLNSHEHQQVQHWHTLLTQLAPLETLTGTFSFDEARHTLRHLAQHTLFQAQTSNSRLQILGTLEGAGLHYTHLWLMGLSANVWPPAPRPDPFIPVVLQRQYDMPHATYERELAITQALMQRYINSAEQLIVSSPRQEDDMPCLPSRLIEAFKESTPADLRLAPENNLLADMANSATLETSPEPETPALSDLHEPLGGTQILQDQAACPFRAFAIHRLHAKPLGEYSPGLSPMARGILLHSALEDLWGTLKDQATLLATAEKDLQTIIHHASQQALSSLKRWHPIGSRFSALESARLEKLLQTALTLERERAPFKVVARETAQTAKIAGLPLRLRVDRVDELEDGTHVIIDYKSNTPSIMSWEGERPDDPQLPLYACVSDKPVSALLFAQINAEKTCYKGLGDAEAIAPGVEVTEDWPEQLEDWQATLAQLATNFMNGVADIAPKDHNTCTYCHLHGLCRINE